MKAIKKISVFLALTLLLSCFSFLSLSAGYNVANSSTVGYSPDRVVKIDTSKMKDLNEYNYNNISSTTTLDSGVTEYKITDGNGLKNLYRFVNTAKQNFSGVTVYLANDLDLTGVTLNPIGGAFGSITDYTMVFSGTFDGQGWVTDYLSQNQMKERY